MCFSITPHHNLRDSLFLVLELIRFVGFISGAEVFGQVFPGSWPTTQRVEIKAATDPRVPRSFHLKPDGGTGKQDKR